MGLFANLISRVAASFRSRLLRPPPLISPSVLSISSQSARSQSDASPLSWPRFLLLPWTRRQRELGICLPASTPTPAILALAPLPHQPRPPLTSLLGRPPPSIPLTPLPSIPAPICPSSSRSPILKASCKSMFRWQLRSRKSESVNTSLFENSGARGSEGTVRAETQWSLRIGRYKLSRAKETNGGVSSAREEEANGGLAQRERREANGLAQ